jgi:hypothetical protein
MFSISATSSRCSSSTSRYTTGNFEQAGALRGAPAALARHDLGTVADAAHENRLNHAMRSNGLRQFFEPRFVHVHARLARIGRQQIDVEIARPCGRLVLANGRRRGGNQRAQSATECRTFVSHV